MNKQGKQLTTSCNTRIMSGTPVFKNTRVPIKNLIDYLEAGDSLDEFLEDFPSVSRVQALQALELAKDRHPVHELVKLYNI